MKCIITGIIFVVHVCIKNVKQWFLMFLFFFIICRQQVEMLKREILDQEKEYKSQIAALETKSHEQWVGILRFKIIW